MSIKIAHIATYCPQLTLSNDDLSKVFNIDSDRIFQTTRITKRYISAPSELSSDMAVKAGENVLVKSRIKPSEIDFLIFCSEGFDFIAPATSCIIHERLGLNSQTGCIDLPYGCSGYVYGLGIAYGLLKAGIASKILFLTADIPTKVIGNDDLELRSIFSDIATASILTQNDLPGNTEFIFGTDGKGAYDLYVEKSAFREPLSPEFKMAANLKNGQMIMNGTNIFLFAVKKVPILIAEILSKNKLTSDDIDLFILHQASYFMLEVIRKKLKLPPDKMFINIGEFGNSVSSSIPLALYDAEQKGILKRGMKIVLAGFGIGNSWGATVIDY
ncbi:MAG: ketoacyl-ACP synthase [Bacteroidota bacterium]|jgi:3-oxoacyl-[acyl-carrier-protein] synthase-3|nr:ketoacyl-ACP synthase [Bacteroidota bacterium]